MLFSLSESDATDALLNFLGGFSFFSGLPSLIDSDLSALRVRFLADPSSAGDEAGPLFGPLRVAAASCETAWSMTVDRKSRPLA